MKIPRRLPHARHVLALTAVACALAGNAATAADPAPSPEVTAAMQPYLDGYKLAGLVGIIADRDGHILHRNILGYADVEAKKPMSDDNVFWIASMSFSVSLSAARRQ